MFVYGFVVRRQDCSQRGFLIAVSQILAKQQQQHSEKVRRTDSAKRDTTEARKKDFISAQMNKNGCRSNQ